MTASQNKTLLIVIGAVFVIALVAFVLYFAHEKEESEQEAKYERILAESNNSKSSSDSGLGSLMGAIIGAFA